MPLQVSDMPIYSRGPQPGGSLYVPDALNNRERPQAREPSKCMNRQSYRERLAKEAFRSPATRGSKKTDRAITPAGEGVRVPAHLEPPWSPQDKQPCHLHAQLSLGQSCHRQERLCFYARGIASVVSDSLLPCRLWLAMLLCQSGGSPGKNTGEYWPILVAIPF